MKTMKQAVLLSFLMPLLLTAQSVVNSGAALTIKSGSAIKINGDYVNQQNGRIKNSGVINLNGNWMENSTAANFLPASGGMVKITGPASHSIGGSYYPVFPELVIETDVNLLSAAYISQNLTLNGGKIDLGDHDLQMISDATLTGASSSQYIITGGTGSLLRTAGGTEKEFPVGTASNYTPVHIVNNGTPDEFAVRVFDDVLTNGSSGTTVPEIEETVNHSWIIADPDGSLTDPDFNMTIQWNGGMEGSAFDRTKASFSGYGGSGWQWFPQTGASGSEPYYLDQTGITGLGAFTVRAKLPVELVLDLKVFLEGPFNGANLNTGLNNLGFLPLAQPYNTSPWNYSEPESVSSIPNSEVVDWVLVEWRDAPDAASAAEPTSFARQAAFLLTDGSVVGLDGNSPLSYSYFMDHELFVLIYHRNHLPVMSKNPLAGTGGMYSYDFTTSADQAYGNGQNNLGAFFGMIGGNGDASNSVNANDKTSVWMIEAGLEGYLSGDFSLDGQVNNRDKNDVWYHNLGKSIVLP